jgi:hypothetical protein
MCCRRYTGVGTVLLRFPLRASAWVAEVLFGLRKWPRTAKPGAMAGGMLSGVLRKLADAAAAAIRTTAIFVEPAVLAQLLATEVAGAEFGYLRTKLRFIAALLSAAALVTGLTELAAAIALPFPLTATAPIVPVLVVIPVLFSGFGVFFPHANGSQEPQHCGCRASGREPETTPGPLVELRLVQRCSSDSLSIDSVTSPEYVKFSSLRTLIASCASDLFCPVA